MLIETKTVHIEKLQARNNFFAALNSKEAIGFSKKGFIYLKNNVAFQYVVSYYRRLGQEFTVSESALRKKLTDNNYILPYNSKSPIHRLSVNHETYQCIKFERAIFEKLIKGGERDDRQERNGEISSDWGKRQYAENILGRCE